MVYSFYDPDLMDQSLGTYVILDHIAIAREAGLPYVYLGYWVPGSRKMGYKAKFAALEIYKGGALAGHRRSRRPQGRTASAVGRSDRRTGRAHHPARQPRRRTRMSARRLGAVALVVPDYDAAIAFFVGVHGLPADRRHRSGPQALGHGGAAGRRRAAGAGPGRGRGAEGRHRQPGRRAGLPVSAKPTTSPATMRG